MERPGNGEKCGVCSHVFGKHYTTYDGKSRGCSNYVDSQRDGGSCYCKGYAVVLLWGAER